MTDLTNTLYKFLSQHYLTGVWEDPEYETAKKYAENKLEQLCSQLEEKQRILLTNLMDDLTLAYSIRQEHIFQATLALSRELSKLV